MLKQTRNPDLQSQPKVTYLSKKTQTNAARLPYEAPGRNKRGGPKEGCPGRSPDKASEEPQNGRGPEEPQGSLPPGSPKLAGPAQDLFRDAPVPFRNWQKTACQEKRRLQDQWGRVLYVRLVAVQLIDAVVAMLDLTQYACCVTLHKLKPASFFCSFSNEAVMFSMALRARAERLKDFIQSGVVWHLSKYVVAHDKLNTVHLHTISDPSSEPELSDVERNRMF